MFRYVYGQLGEVYKLIGNLYGAKVEFDGNVDREYRVIFESNNKETLEEIESIIDSLDPIGKWVLLEILGLKKKIRELDDKVRLLKDVLLQHLKEGKA